ncbi:MAG TPA: Ig-like domain-containing protein [Terriglobales bacterium]|jgi:hypothetical protein
MAGILSRALSVGLAVLCASAAVRAQEPVHHPAVRIDSPAEGEAVGRTVRLHAELTDSADPAATIAIAIDNRVVATANGGTAEKILELTPGAHIVQVSVWDISGRLVESSRYFTVSAQPVKADTGKLSARR